MKRLLPTLALCTMLLALPLLSPASRVQAAAIGWPDTGHAEEMYQARNFERVSQSPHVVRTFRTPMFDMIELILGAVPGITVTADIMQKDPKYAHELNQKSAVAGIGNYIAMIYANPPADLALWIRDTGQTLGFLPKQAYAQGVGFSDLAPLLPIWKAFRNIAYLLLAVVMIVIGFMVMLRKKIDPKTVVTVQNAIPRIVVTLLLITFSYAIVGVMIDLMYLMILIPLVLLKNAGLIPNLTWFQKLFNFGSPEQAFTTGNLAVYFSMLFPWAQGSLIDVVYQIFGLGGTVTAGLVGAGVGALAGFFAGGATALPGAAIGLISGAGGLQVFIVLLLSIFLLFLFVRLFILVLSAYVQIVLALIIGPIQLLSGAIPGNNGFASWIMNLVTNMLTFPIIGIMGMIAVAFGTAADKYYNFWQGGGQLWTPPYGITGGNAQSISALMSLGVLMVIPQVVGSVKEALKAKPFIPAGPGVITSSLSQAWGTSAQLFHFWSSRRMEKAYGESAQATQEVLKKISERPGS